MIQTARSLQTPGSFQFSTLARLLHSIAAFEQGPTWGDLFLRDWDLWPEPPQPEPADLRQRAEATLVALLEGPHGG